ncbi:Fic family protein [Geothermobacter ehrlichii]|uniref:Fic family protein n=1 Tax=Geothermobacter ehrlichii TaxID=213224 RepID=A0A5D3WI28_9BACT|nr:Fic family protein [Geothermobacter ehrlichii]TYO96738.1 Fic family protein [Geothermobacter ehrlichii]
MAETSLYSNISEMEPLLPSVGDSSLTDLAVEVIRRSAALSSFLHPVTRRAVVELVRSMNSYYSNLIEGHNTHPVDIERALARDYSHDPAKRAMQMESAAHIEVQRLIEARLRKSPDLDICSHDFLCWIHREFYARLPEEFCHVQAPDGSTKQVVPGELRQEDVTVGRHVAPSHHALPDFLSRFQAVYSPERLNAVNKVIAAAASHHRLAWIHPFLDGNGRVTRLFTHAYLIRAQIDGHGLWTVSRGLARNREAYLAALAGADAHRQGDLDGRGNLSNRGLVAFCTFFLEMALDQVHFMSDLLELDGLQKRMTGYVERQVSFGELAPEAAYLLREALLRGEVPRGEAARITGRPERTARRILKSLLDRKLLVSDSEKGPVRLFFPASVAGYYFPRLYPEGVEFSEPR